MGLKAGLGLRSETANPALTGGDAQHRCQTGRLQLRPLGAARSGNQGQAVRRLPLIPADDAPAAEGAGPDWL
ncbi:hypothetical protein D3C72_535340 [compost metagenome]